MFPIPSEYIIIDTINILQTINLHYWTETFCPQLFPQKYKKNIIVETVKQNVLLDKFWLYMNEVPHFWWEMNESFGFPKWGYFKYLVFVIPCILW